jgi:hypothetical protein
MPADSPLIIVYFIRIVGRKHKTSKRISLISAQIPLKSLQRRSFFRCLMTDVGALLNYGTGMITVT